jgi:xylulokinase
MDLGGVSDYVAAGRVFHPEPARAAVYDQAYANYREIYERLKTLYPKLDLSGIGHLRGNAA